MKKLLFILMAVLSLCACSSNDDSVAEVSNKFSVDGKDYPIEQITVGGYFIKVKSGNYTLNAITNDRVTLGKKNYLTAYPSFNAGVWKDHGDVYGSGEFTFKCDNEDITKSSYLLIKENDEDNRIYIEALFGNGTKTVTLTYFGTVDISHIVKKE
jgi:hypothetical protein